MWHAHYQGNPLYSPVLTNVIASLVIFSLSRTGIECMLDVCQFAVNYAVFSVYCINVLGRSMDVKIIKGIVNS